MISTKSHCHNTNDHVTYFNITYPRTRSHTVGQHKETSLLHQKLRSVSNNMQPDMQRWYSLPALCNTRRRWEPIQQGIPEATLRRTKGLENINYNCQGYIKITITVVYQRVYNIEKLDADNYIYLASMRKTAFLNQGVTLDDDGNLLLIKGKSKNFFKQTLAKFNDGNKIYMARIKLTEDGSWLFSRLSLDPNGRLLAEQKQTKESYEITINTATTSKSFDVDSIIDDNHQIEITLKKTFFNTQVKNRMKLTPDKENSDEIYLSSNNLYLLEKDLTTDTFIKNKLKLPLSSKVEICSVKKEINHVKLSLKIAGVSKIKYFHPKHMDKKSYKVTHLSPKPPQSLYSGTGADLHEKVYSGQPFGEIQWSHFSSKNLLFFSWSTDNIRVNFRRARHHCYSGQATKAGLAFIDAIDPGVRCLTKVIGAKVKSKFLNKSDSTDEKSLSDNVVRMKNFIQGKKINEIISSTTDFFDYADPPAEKMRILLSLLEKNESITLKKEEIFSCFFGVAKAGLPIISGFFVGALVRLLTHHSLTFSRNENNNITINFSRGDSRSLIFLGGTGQGLEEKAKFLSVKNIDYGTLLPIEANLILVLNMEKENDFSFEIEWNHINEFLLDLFDPGDRYQYIVRLQKNGSLNITHSKGLNLLAEAKSELRPQVGFKANPITYMVLPRTALGMAEAINFFSCNVKHNKKINFDNDIIEKSRWVEKRYPYFSMTLFGEAKIMPIPMTVIDSSSDHIYCYPLPLIEKVKQKLCYTDNRLLRHYRLNGTVLQFKIEPWVPAEPKIVKEINNESEVRQPISDLLEEDSPNISYKAAIEFIDFIQEKLSLADKGEHFHQSIKPAKAIGDFVISRGDYHGNLKLLKYSINSEAKVNNNDYFSTLKMFLKLAKRWRKHTTLGEYLKLKSKQIKGHAGKDLGRKTVFDFIDSIEKFAAENERINNRKSSTVNAIAIYRLPEQTLDLLKREFDALSLTVREKIVKGKPITAESQQLAKMKDVLAVADSVSKSLYQLDNITLVRQSTVAIETGTLPCTILHLCQKNELIHSKSLSSIKFEYREGEVFPYRLESSLNIMPDMWY